MLPRLSSALPSPSLLLLFLLFYSSQGDEVVNPRVSQSFEGRSFSNIVYSPKTKDVYVSAVNHIYQLTAANLEKISELTIGPVRDHMYCPLNEPDKCRDTCRIGEVPAEKCKIRLTDTVVRGMTLDSEYLYVCYNIHLGFCQRLDLTNIAKVISTSLSPVVCADATTHVTMLVGRAPGSNAANRKALYLGVTKCNSTFGHFNEMQTLTTRRLDNFELVRGNTNKLPWIESETSKDLRGDHTNYFKIYFRYSFEYSQANADPRTPPTLFAYYLVVQHENVESQKLVTRLGRICNEDPYYLSYIELTLRCTSKDSRGRNIDYNIAESAHLAQAGTNLERSLDIPEGDLVLYVAFRSSKRNEGMGHTNKGAVCVYSMKEIQTAYHDILKNCLLEGKSNIGPPHYRERSKCNKLHSVEERKKVTIGYCYKDRTNTPLSGEMIKLVKKPVVQFENADVMSVRGGRVSRNYTVLQLGLSDGRLLQYEIGESKPTLLDTNNLGSSPIIRLEKSNEANFIFAMSPKKVSKVRLYDCSQFRTCHQCQAAAQPYCGWCILRSNCTTQAECPLHRNWIPSYTPGIKCPSVESLDPPGYQIHSTEPNRKFNLKMRVANVPLQLFENATLKSSPRLLRCCFTRGTPCNATASPLSCGEKIYAFTEVAVEPRGKYYHLRCMTPTIECLPSIPDGLDHVSVRVSLVVMTKMPSDRSHVADLSTRHKSVVLESDFFVYDCSHYRSCSSCVRSKFACSWCVVKNECRDSRRSMIECEKAEIVNHKKSVECPRFEHKKPSVIVRAAGLKKSRFRLRVKRFSALKEFTANYSCVLRCPGQTPKVVRAREVRPREGRARKKDVLVCVYHWLDYREAVGRMRCSLDLRWLHLNGFYRHLENANNVSVELYKCEHMVSSCGECLLDLPSVYKCGWCHNRCSLRANCSHYKWQDRTEVCKSPSIIEIEPRNATVHGEVNVTIKGRNLGRSFPDIKTGVRLILDGSNAELPCVPDPKGYVKGKQIQCRLQLKNSNMPAKGHFKVTVVDEFSCRSRDVFSFLSPHVTAVAPRIGPVSGGTFLCLNGTNLYIGRSQKVFWHFADSPEDKNGTDLMCSIRSVSKSQICCVTSNGQRIGKVLLRLAFDRNVVKQSHQSFSFEDDPKIKDVTRKGAILSGGLAVKVTGSNLEVAAKAHLLLQKDSRNVSSPCTRLNAIEMSCPTPSLTSLFPSLRLRRSASSYRPLGYVHLGFIMDSVPGLLRLEKLAVFPDPVIYSFTDGRLVRSLDKENTRPDDTLKLRGQNLAGAIVAADIEVKAGDLNCLVITLRADSIICLLNKIPVTDTTLKVTVRIGDSFSRDLGELIYRSNKALSKELIIGIAVGVFVLLLVIVGSIICVGHCHTKERSKMKAKMEREISEMEMKVATECKEAFAELQMAMSEVTHALALASPNGQRRLPFRDYRLFCLQQLFPNQEHAMHPVITPLEIPRERYAEFDTGFRRLSELMKNRTFILVTIKALEAQSTFTARDRSNFASLLSAALQSKMEYFTDLLKVLLSEFITQNIDKHREKLLFRRSESVAEKMLANWLTFLLFDYLQDRAGEPLYLLSQAIWLQISSGPVDAITNESRYTLSDEKLIRESVNCSEERLIVTDPFGVFEEIHNNEHDWELTVKVLDVDTVTQVKEKILFAIYRHTAYSQRPNADDVDLELAEPINSHPEKAHLTSEARVMQDIDDTCETETRGNRMTYRRLNTLKHYMRLWGFKSGAYVKLSLRSNRCDTNSYKGENASSLVNSTSNLIGTVSEFDRADTILSVAGNTLPQSLGHSASYVHFGTSMRVVEDGPQVTNYHLVKPNEDQREDTGGRPSKMVSEAQLNRLVFTKKCIQRYIDDFLRTVFAVSLDSSTGTDPVLPLCIKYMFDFLDDQARNHSLTDFEVVHVWKSNCLPLRFWIGVVKNPEFLFDIAKTPGVGSSLSVVAQTLMESCNWLRTELTKDSPATKLLFAQETPSYRELVINYYKDIKSIPAISDQEMNAHLIAHSNKHANDFDATNSFYTLYLQYISRYMKQISDALETDVSAKRQRLSAILSEVHFYLSSSKC